MSEGVPCAFSRRHPWGRWSAVAAIALGAGAAIAWNVLQPRVVHAAGLPTGSDSDGDGLPDKLELAHGCDPYLVDSDFDGVSDAEEFARHSSPSNGSQLPGASAASVGMGITANGAKLRFVTAIYIADGVLNDKQLKLGVVKSSTPVYLPKTALGTSTNVTVVPASVPGQLVLVYEAPITAAILRGGDASIFSVLTGPGGVKAADAVNLALIDSTFCQRFILTTQSGGSPGTTLQTSPHGGGAGGVVFKPVGGSSPPATWTPGEICNQTTQLVGYSGGAAVQEVVGAYCETGWDAYCDPSCAASVGTTITLLDPAVLVGG